jgi:hypothetical protein
MHCPQEEGLSEVHSLSELEDPNVEKMLRAVLEEMSISCARFVSITKGNGSGAGMGKTKLDKERLKLCQREIVSLYSTLKPHSTLMETVQTTDGLWHIKLRLPMLQMG